MSLKLRSAVTLTIDVVDDTGAAIAGAAIEVRTGDPLPFVASTDLAGRASLDRLGPPGFHVQATAPGFETASQNVTQLSSAPLRFSLRKLGSFDVVTVDTEGRKVSNATVLVSGSGLWPAKQTRTDLEGHAQVLDLARGFYDFRATRGDLVSPPGTGSPLGRGETKTVTLVLAPGRKVAVRVVDGEEKGAKGVAGASLVLSEGGLSSFPLEGKTDARGGATLGPIAAGRRLSLGARTGFVARTGVPIANGPPVEVVVPLVRGATLHGEVVDSRGFPVDGASIEVVGTTASGEPIDESPERTAFRAAHFSVGARRTR